MRSISEYVQHQAFILGGEGAHGNEIEDWAPGVALGIYAYNPSTSSEILIDGHMHRVETKPIIYLPSSAAVGNRDKITARGITFEVDGDPSDFRNPFDDAMDGISINLKDVSG